MKNRNTRRVITWTGIWLLAVGAGADFIKPQLDLRRMLIPLGFLFALPAALGLRVVLDQALNASLNNKTVGRVVQFCGLVLVLGWVLLTPVNVRAIYRNRSDDLYRFTGEQMSGLTRAITALPGDGRTLFLGFVLHELESSSTEGRDGGHLAPLSKFTGKKLFASHFMHARWSTVDPIPRAYLNRDDAGGEEFLDLMNVTAVVTFRPEWRRYCQSHSRYHLAYSDERVWLFTRDSESKGYFLSGSGEITSQRTGLIKLVPSSEEEIVKFRYQPELEVYPAGSAAIEGVQYFDEDLGGGRTEPGQLIKLKVTPEAIARHQELTIAYPGSIH